MKPAPKNFLQHILIFLAVAGPGIITANADNDGTGIAGYTVVGARYGYKMLFSLLIITLILAVTQELGARIGVATGKGLGGVIREKFGLRLTIIAMLAMLISNLGIIIANIGAIAEAMQLFGVAKFISVPIFVAGLWFILYKGSYAKAEKIFLVSSCLYIVYIMTAFIVHPNWGEAIGSLFKPSIEFNTGYLSTLMILIGTTVTIWGQFFIQAFVVDKGIPAKKYPYQRAEIFLGAFFTDLISFFIIVTAANTLFTTHTYVTTAGEAALALKPLAGAFATQLFAFGLLNAGLLGASIVTLSTAYALCEAIGFESKMDRSWHQASAFYWIISSILLCAALLVMIPGLPLFQILLLSNNVNGIILPIIMLYVYAIANDRRIMGRFASGRLANAAAIGSILLLSIASVSLVGFSLFG